MPICDICGSKLKNPISKRHLRSKKHRKAWEKIKAFRVCEEHVLKICVIASYGVEKTSLIRRFAEGKFAANYSSTLGVDVTTKKIRVNNHIVILILMDTAPQEFFGKLRASYYRGASACTLFFNKSDFTTFETIPDLLMEFRTQVPDESTPIALVGIIKNSEHVSTEEGRKLANTYNLTYYEIKPTVPKAISRIFHDLASQVLNKYPIAS